MLWVSVIAGVAFTTALIIVLAWVAVNVFGALRNALSIIEMTQQRAQDAQRALLDRLMSMDWEAVRTFESGEGEEEGGFIAPDDQEEATVEVETRSWGHLNAKMDRFSDEERLLDEDFPREETPT